MYWNHYINTSSSNETIQDVFVRFIFMKWKYTYQYKHFGMLCWIIFTHCIRAVSAKQEALSLFLKRAHPYGNGPNRLKLFLQWLHISCTLKCSLSFNACAEYSYIEWNTYCIIQHILIPQKIKTLPRNIWSIWKHYEKKCHL